MLLIINHDSTFTVSDEAGDICDHSEQGLYIGDTRVLRLYALTLDQRKPLLLTARATDPRAAVHFLTNPSLEDVPRGTLGIIRRRDIADGLVEELEITNYGNRVANASLEFALRPDAAHVITVRQQLKRTGPPRLPTATVPKMVEGGRRLCFDQRGVDPAHRLVVDFCHPPQMGDGRWRFLLSLAPRQPWHLCMRLTVGRLADRRASSRACRRERTGDRSDLIARRDALIDQAPRLATDRLTLHRAYERSLDDLAALRITGEASSADEVVIAAGIPWFAALFGRDSLIAAYQALPFSPGVAKGVLRALARLQGTRVDPLRHEEPGKILHEYRPGVADGAQDLIPSFPYFGTIDATPLFLMVLAAVFRVTGDLAFVRSLRENAVRALEWLDAYGDRDGDGYLEYAPDGGRGLANHGWKDSSDSVQFRDGTLARPPIALCEVQGYAYAARTGMAEVFEALGDTRRAAELSAAANRLRERFERDFWLPEQSYYALALDGEKQPVDAITSNPGHLLWSGMIARDRARLVARRLLSPELFSGWGVRTMASTERGYNPISYHNGSVWPHDTSLIVAGLARYGLLEEAARLTGGLLSSLDGSADCRLPEVFAGYGRNETPFPVAHPLASRPQAWAAGSALLLLSSMLGFDASVSTLEGSPFLPAGVNHLVVEGLWHGHRRIALRVDRTRLREIPDVGRSDEDDAARAHVS